jgi:hypothetical protein
MINTYVIKAIAKLLVNNSFSTVMFNGMLQDIKYQTSDLTQHRTQLSTVRPSYLNYKLITLTRISAAGGRGLQIKMT